MGLRKPEDDILERIIRGEDVVSPEPMMSVGEPTLPINKLEAPANKSVLAEMTQAAPELNIGKLESPDARKMVIQDALRKKFEAPQVDESQFSDDSMVADAIRQGGKDKLVAMLGSGGADLIKGATGLDTDASPYNAMYAGAGGAEKTVRDYLSQKYDRAAKQKAYDLQLAELQGKNQYQKQTLDLQKEQNEIARAKAEAELKNSGNKIPDAIKPAADKMSEKIINKASALNQLDSMVAEMKAAKDVSSQIAVGERMLKLLNSLEGSDAVGADEAKRLANKLEFAWGNLTNKYPTRVGRDIEGFIKDAETQSRAGKAALEKDKAVWGGLTGKSLPVDTQKNGSGKMVTIKNDETGETKTVSEEEARALGAL